MNTLSSHSLDDTFHGLVLEGYLDRATFEALQHSGISSEHLKETLDHLYNDGEIDKTLKLLKQGYSRQEVIERISGILVRTQLPYEENREK